MRGAVRCSERASSAQIVVAGGQRLLEDRRIQQAFGVSADLRHAAGEGSREKKRQQAGQHQHRERDSQQRTPQLGAMPRHVQIHAEQRSRQQCKATPQKSANNTTAHGIW